MKKSVNNLINHFSFSSFASLISFLTILYFTLDYSPEEIALWGSYLVIVPIILVINLSIFSELALVEKKKTEVIIFTIYLFIISSIISFLCTFSLYLFIDYTPYKQFYNLESEKKKFISFLFIFIILLIFKNLQTSFLIRFSKFKILGKLNFLRAIFFFIIGYFLNNKNLIFNGIILAFIISESLVFLLSIMINKVPILKYVDFTNNKFINFFKIFRKYSGWAISSYFLNTLAYFIIFNFILINFSKNEAGIYTALSRIILAPIQLINKIVGDIFVSQVSKSLRIDFKSMNTFNNFSYLLLSLSLVLFLIGFFFLPHIYNYINWNSSVNLYYQFYKPFLIYGCFMMVSSTLSRYLIVSKNFKTDFVWQTLFFISVLILCNTRMVFYDFLFYLSTILSSLYVVYYFMIRQKIKKMN